MVTIFDEWISKTHFFHVKPHQFHTIAQSNKWRFNHVTFLACHSSVNVISVQLWFCELGLYTSGEWKFLNCEQHNITCMCGKRENYLLINTVIYSRIQLKKYGYLAVINERCPVCWNVMAFLFEREIWLYKNQNICLKLHACHNQGSRNTESWVLDSGDSFSSEKLF